MQSLSMKVFTSGFATIIFACALTALPIHPAFAASRAAIDKDVSAALKHLYATNPAAKMHGLQAGAQQFGYACSS